MRCTIVYEDGPERDARFYAGNDQTWGADNWFKCYQCPPDDHGLPIYHWWAAHP